MTKIQIQSLSKTFPSGLETLKDISMDISAGEFLSIIGPSGCGKSTLLRIIAGLESPSLGTATHLKSSNISYVFQEPHLIPWRSALRNVLLPLELMSISKEAAEAKAKQTLELIGLKNFENSYPHQLSGGMKMRVSLARALVTEPETLLLDEPFAALDEITRQKLDEDLRRLWEQKKMTVIFVTHSLPEAVFLSNRSIVFSHRPGRVILDHSFNIPGTRNAETKTSQPYVQEMALLFRALERGEK